MFDQTFVNGTQDGKKPYTILLSLLLQIFVICVLMAIPLLYSEMLPSAQLRSLLVAPPVPPRSIPMQRVTSSHERAMIVRPFRSDRLTAPKVIPKQVNRIEEAAPAIGVSASSGEQADAPAGAIFGPLGAVPATAPPVAEPRPKKPVGPIRVGGRVAQANLIRQIQPVYPPLAKSARVQGTVEFTATIAKDGSIENLQLVRGHPLLVNAAREAVSQWKYRPTLLNGQPVEVVTDIVVNFTLNP